MAEQGHPLFCSDCGKTTAHTLVQLTPRKANPDATLFQRATIMLSNSIDFVLGSTYQQCDQCGSTFGHTDYIGGI